MQILGLDPGLRQTGWAVIAGEGQRLRCLGQGVIAPPQKEALSDRLAWLYREITEIIVRFSPQQAAVEEVFVNKNPTSTLKLGMARGVVLMAPAAQGLVVGEYSANHVKKAVTGSGHAQKDQIQMMVKLLTGVQDQLAPDAADAMAVAICHIHHQQIHHQQSYGSAQNGKQYNKSYSKSYYKKVMPC